MCETPQTHSVVVCAGLCDHTATTQIKTTQIGDTMAKTKQFSAKLKSTQTILNIKHLRNKIRQELPFDQTIQSSSPSSLTEMPSASRLLGQTKENDGSQMELCGVPITYAKLSFYNPERQTIKVNLDFRTDATEDNAFNRVRFDCSARLSNFTNHMRTPLGEEFYTDCVTEVQSQWITHSRRTQWLGKGRQRHRKKKTAILSGCAMYVTINERKQLEGVMCVEDWVWRFEATDFDNAHDRFCAHAEHRRDIGYADPKEKWWQ